MQTGREKFPPKTWPLWVFWLGLLLGAMYWAFGLIAVGITLAVIAIVAFLVANDLLG